MLEIRDAQYQALAKDHRERYHREILAVVRESFSPDQVGRRTDEELLARIDAAHTRANGRDIDGRSAVAKFAILDILAGPEFDTIPAVDEHLRRSGTPADEKLDGLYEQLSARMKGA